MALSVTEANAVNVLLRWLLEESPNGTPLPTWHDARIAAMLLADHANRTLMAGFSGQAVERIWMRRLEEGRPVQSITWRRYRP